MKTRIISIVIVIFVSVCSWCVLNGKLEKLPAPLRSLVETVLSQTEKDGEKASESVAKQHDAKSVKDTSVPTYVNGRNVEGKGVVVTLLQDDTEGTRHQKFILRDAAGKTLLVAHNITLAPRIEGLQVGDTVEFFGEYRENEKGGVIHWTHLDPNRRHVSGWLRYKGRVYQ
ncbi:MAG: DUF3465 domain-containing protein [Kiritimatiellae bacterium]|nr:DUF3465 domain-containing protein [Kiritimatiellia bacterium]